MRRSVLLVCWAIFISYCLANSTVNPNVKVVARDNPFTIRERVPEREVPPFTVTVPPVSLLTSYWDYMIGNYNGLPLQVIPPNQGGGYMMTFMGQRTPTTDRRVFYGYINANGQVVAYNEINSFLVREGFSSIAYDPVLGKPMYAWHSNRDADTQLEVSIVAEAFIDQISGLFNDPQIIVNNPTTITLANGTTVSNNEFIWPTIISGPSPIAGKRRFYVATRNSISNTSGPCENIYISYTDANADDFEMSTMLVWNHTSIPTMNEWNSSPSDYIRPNYTIVADNQGKLYCIGYHTVNNDSNGSMQHELLGIFISDNYGTGAWRRVSFTDALPTWNPNGYFTNTSSVPYQDHQLKWGIINSGHLNAALDNNGHIHFGGLWTIITSDNTYYPRLHSVKEVLFNTWTESFGIRDIYPQSGNPYGPYQPWDMEAPWNEVDAYDANNLPVMNTTFPFPYWDNGVHDGAMGFYYNNVKQSHANSEGMMVCVWQDSERARRINADANPAYAQYSNTPEIFISASSDNGFSWSEPIKINQIDTPAFANIKPMWVYPANKVNYVGMQNGRKLGKLGLMFYDDYDWGANSISPPVHPTNNGGRVMFAELQILFPDPQNVVDEPWDEPIVLANSMTINASVYFNNSNVQSGCILAAFTDVDGQPVLRGKSTLQYAPLATLCPLTVYTENVNELIYFKLWDPISWRQYLCDTTVFSSPGTTLGALPDNPFPLYFGNLLPRVATPIFSLAGGLYTAPVTVEILCGTPNAQIHYSIGATANPSINTPLYTEPLQISSTTTLKAIAFVPGFQDSPIAQAQYIINIYHAPVTNLVAQVHGRQVSLSWQAPTNLTNANSNERRAREDMRPPTSYRVFRNGILLEEITETTFVETDVPNGTYIYTVTAVYPTGLSNPTSVNVTVNVITLPVFWNESFESHYDFETTFFNWRCLDLDEQHTFYLPGYSYPHYSDPKAFMIFCPSATIPPIDYLTAYDGQKMVAAFAPIVGSANDWLISPAILLGTSPQSSNATFSFVARSLSDANELERMRIYVSTNSSYPIESFQVISGAEDVIVPSEWTEYSYDISQYVNQTLRIGINYISENGAMLMLDSFAFYGFNGQIVSTDEPIIPVTETRLLGNFPNPFNPETTIRYSLLNPAKVSLEIYNQRGQLVRSMQNNHAQQGIYSLRWDGKDQYYKRVSSGIYYYRLITPDYSETKKMVLMK